MDLPTTSKSGFGCNPLLFILLFVSIWTDVHALSGTDCHRALIPHHADTMAGAPEHLPTVNRTGEKAADHPYTERSHSVTTSDLSLSIATSFNSFDPGTTLVFEIELTNDGPIPATNVVIQNEVPMGYTVQVVSISSGGILSGNTITWALGEVPLGRTTLVYSAIINESQGMSDEYANIVQIIGADQEDLDSTPNNDDGDQSEDDEDRFNPLDGMVDITIEKNVQPQLVNIGDDVVFRITVGNIGGLDATNLVISENLPDGYRFLSSESSLGSFDASNLEWSIDRLASGGQAILSIMATVVNGTDYINTATVDSLDQGDSNITNNQGTALVTIDQDCVVVYNEFSPNQDGVNDTLHIDCIENFPDNQLQVFNRWGNIVFETTGYTNDWDGTSTGRSTIIPEDRLPAGTYFYVLKLVPNNTNTRTGWLYISR